MWTIGLTLLLLQATSAGALPAPGVLTELEQLRIANVGLQEQLAAAYADGDACRAELAPVRKAQNEEAIRVLRAKLIGDLEAAHPCCTYDPQTQQLMPRVATP